MQMTTILLILIILFIASKISDVILRKSEVKKEKNKMKMIIPGLNILYVYSFDEFKAKIHEYLELEYNNVQEIEDEFFSVENEREKIIFYIRQVKEFSEVVDMDDFYILVAQAHDLLASKAILITNGKVTDDIKIMKVKNDSNIDIDYIDSQMLVKKLTDMKKEKILKGEL